MSIYDLPAQEFNDSLAEALEKLPEFKMPEWALFVKTGVSKIKPPTDNDWWYHRAASIIRQVSIRGLVGVSRLRVRYGSKQNRGMKPEKFTKSSGKLIRTILQQAETAGFLEKVVDGKKRGRKLTEKGKQFLDSIKITKPKKEKQEPIVNKEEQEVKELKQEPIVNQEEQENKQEIQELNEQKPIEEK